MEPRRLLGIGGANMGNANHGVSPLRDQAHWALQQGSRWEIIRARIVGQRGHLDPSLVSATCGARFPRHVA
jgi:hypothetical protein